LLDEWEPEPVSADFDERLYRRIETQEGRSWWRTLFRPVLPFSLRPVVPLAAACLLAVAALLVRTPVGLGTNEVVRAEPVDIEQVERALEDMEMLLLLDAELQEQQPAQRTL
jgi:hypothetical protein